MFKYIETEVYGKKLMTVENSTTGRHYHFKEDNEIAVYPSMTTVLGSFTDQGILDWRNRVGEDYANFIQRIATSKGTKLHDLVERYLKNDFLDLANVMPDVKQLFINMRENLNRIDQIRLLEYPLYSDLLRVAGRVDCIADFDRTLSVIDFKISNALKSLEDIQHYCEQVTGYGIMFRERTNINVKNGVIIMTTPEGCKVFKFNLINHARSLADKIRRYQDA